MHYRSLSLAALTSLALVGCVPQQGALVGYNALRAGVISDAELRLTALRKIITDSNETRAVLLKLDDTPTGRCQAAPDHEAEEFARRIRALKVIENYAKLLAVYEEKNARDNAEFAALVGAVNAVAAIPGNPAAPLAAPVTQLMATSRAMIAQIERHQFDREIRKLAQENRTAFVKVVDDLAAGLIIADADLNTKIKIWEECEAELINWHAENRNGSHIEFEERYRIYLRKNALILDALKSYEKIDIAEHPISKLKAAHEKLYSYAALSSAERLAYITQMIGAVSEFNANREKSLELFKAIVAQAG